METDYSRPPFVFVVVRNIGRGAARNISSQFSAPVESPESADPHSLVVPVNEQLYFKRGMDFLSPGAELPCLWGSMINLAPFLRERGLQDGITVTSKYESLLGESFENEWVLNPLLVASRTYLGGEKGVKEVAEAIEQVAEILSAPMDFVHGEVQVTTHEERQKRALLLEQLRAFLKDNLQNSGAGDPPQAHVSRGDIESVGQDPRAAVELFGRHVNELGYWFGEFEDLDEARQWTSFRPTNVM